jgi:hypothetical protein
MDVISIQRLNNMNKFKLICNFFNTKNNNKLFTRAEYVMAMKPYKIKECYLDTVRCYLMRADYLQEFQLGV